MSFSGNVKYIDDRTKAVYELHILKGQKKDETSLKKPMRDRAFVSFLHLLRIWHDLNK